MYMYMYIIHVHVHVLIIGVHVIIIQVHVLCTSDFISGHLNVHVIDGNSIMATPCITI